MKNKRRRRYKKKKYDLFLIFKIALICYLAIFGTGYMTSNTSAYLSSQSKVFGSITADIWEFPQIFVNACGQEYTIDEVTGEIVYLDLEIIKDSPIEKSETDVLSSGEEESDSEAIDHSPTDESEADVISSGEEENDSQAKDDTPIEESQTDVITSDEEKIDIEDKGDNPLEESEKDVISIGEEVIDCMDMDGSDPTLELGCEGNDGSLVGENTTASKEEIIADCNINDEPIEESEIVAPENIETIEQENEEQNELENGIGEGEKESDTKTDVKDGTEEELQKPNDESVKQQEGKDDSVTELKEKNAIDKDSTKDEASKNSTDQNNADEMNDAVKQEENIQKVEGDTNEIQ